MDSTIGMYNNKRYIKFVENGYISFIKKDDISMVTFQYNTNNQLIATIILKGTLRVANIVPFHKNNYNEYLELCNAIDYEDCITEEEWNKTMKVSYK